MRRNGLVISMDMATWEGAATILVVEDDELVSEVLAEALQGSYQAISVGSAAAALERLGDRRYDLILLDCLIPGGGAELVIERAGRLGIPLVLMSGIAERAAAASAGRHKFITKPFSLEELLRTIETTLQPGR